MDPSKGNTQDTPKSALCQRIAIEPANPWPDEPDEICGAHSYVAVNSQLQVSLRPAAVWDAT